MSYSLADMYAFGICAVLGICPDSATFNAASPYEELLSWDRSAAGGNHGLEQLKPQRRRRDCRGFRTRGARTFWNKSKCECAEPPVRGAYEAPFAARVITVNP